MTKERKYEEFKMESENNTGELLNLQKKNQIKMKCIKYKAVKCEMRRKDKHGSKSVAKYKQNTRHYH